jgi:apolipoprotein N-acyltransferase
MCIGEGATALVDWIRGLTGWRRVGAAFLAGLASALAFAPTHLAPLLFLTFPILLTLLDQDDVLQSARERMTRGFAAAWAFGFGYHLVGLHWIGHAFLVQADIFAWALPFAVTLLPAGLAIFFGLAGVVVTLTPARALWRPVAFVLAFATAEWLRSVILTGFPWNVIGYALAWPLELMQAFAVVGLHGLTLMTLTLAVAPFLVWRRLGRDPERTAFAVAAAFAAAAVPLAALYGFGAARLASIETTELPGVRLRLVQPSIDQTEKWQPDKQAEIFRKHLDLTAGGTASGDRAPQLAATPVTHIIWAEAAMPFRPLDSAYALERLAATIPDGKHLIAGILRSEPRGTVTDASRSSVAAQNVFNSTVVLDASARTVGLYDKFHLVPFGEYLPFPALFEAIGFETLVRERGGFTPAVGTRTPMTIPGLPPVEMLICYEAIFPHEVAIGRTRPGLLMNLTNDGWFGTWSGPHQHFLQTRARAVEQGIPLVRVSNNGISAVIDPAGRVHGPILGLNAVAVADVGVPHAIQPTVYARWRDWPALGIALLILMAGVIAHRWPQTARGGHV